MTEAWNARAIPERVARRALERADKLPNGCRISRYSVASHGYAQIGWAESGRTFMVLAHRAAWVAVNGQMPLGMTLDHTCKERRCVNPEHLRTLPNYENARRVGGMDWPLGTCANGHPHGDLEPVTRRTKSGARRVGRRCRTCNLAAQARYRARKRASA